MTISEQLLTHLEDENFDAVEAEFLSLVERNPEDLNTFLAVADTLDAYDQEERARTLLAVVDDALKERQAWEPRLLLIKRTGGRLFPPGRVHQEVMGTLKAVYGERETFLGFIEAVRLDKAASETDLLWEKLERFESLIACNPGAVVWMDGKGVGRVSTANMALLAFKVDFQRIKGLTVGFRAAGKHLRALEEGHILRRQLETPDEVRQLAKDQPSELLRMILENYDRPLTAAEIKQNLEGIVPANKWTSWWPNARKHPQVVAHKQGRQTYSWAASTRHAADANWRRFESVEPREKIAMLRREADKDPALTERMRKALIQLGETAWQQGDHGLSFEVYQGLERTGGAPEGVEWTAEHLIAESTTLQDLVGGIQDRTQRLRAYELVRERRTDWIEAFTAFLAKEEDARGLELLSQALRKEAPQGFWSFVDLLLASHARNPAAFVWLAETGREDEELRDRSPLRFLQQLLSSLTSDVAASYRASRLVPLCESGGTLPRILSHLAADQAEAAAESIERAPGLESYQRKDLLTALELRFPSLRQEETTIIYSTPEKIAQKREELRVLLQEEIPANRTAIEEARAMGDLRENFEYKSARQRHEYLSARQAQLENELSVARPIDFAHIDTSQVRIGSRANLTQSDGTKERSITILGPWDSEPEKGILAYESDMAQAILGKKINDEVKLSGETWRIETIERHR